ncbi:MAG: glycosyltransferase family 2 protein [Epibacterium sp.]|nr:glycosyltransferase family 2 protein [Epibacterium sp.]NQX72893.1 glycosyltransferase family 2 protein [Epibacterium sp.]
MRAQPLPKISLGQVYHLRWKRRRLLWRCLRARREMQPVNLQLDHIRPDAILAVVVLRNEAVRLPYFLEYYRSLGVDHFLMVDNGSDDGSTDILTAQGDVSLWNTRACYRDARFGLDWSGWLLMRYGHGHWCLTLDVDELLTYPGVQDHGVRDLTKVLAAEGRDGFGAMMLDLYPKGALGAQDYAPGQDPTEVLMGFDAEPYRAQRQAPMGNLWLQGGVRERVFFQHNPQSSPTLNKLPLVRWNRRFAYTNSTHSLLPRHLNTLYNGPLGQNAPSGVLLHSKFLPDVIAKSEEDTLRQQHFHNPPKFIPYYAAIASAPDLWHRQTQVYDGPDGLETLGLCKAPDWRHL